MSASEPPFLRAIFHPTDFSPGSEQAFAHALAICLIREGELTLLHAGKSYLEADQWQQFPAVRKTLERWKLLEKGSDLADVFRKLGVRINKVNAVGDPLHASMEFLAESPADLIVVATEGREGLPRWIRQSTAEELARQARINTLFVPHETRGFIDLGGEITLKRILVPVDRSPDPRAAVVYAGRATILAAGDPVELIALHVGDEMPELELPEVPGSSWTTELRPGDPEDEIVRMAEERNVDLIFMPTAGPSGILEALGGSTTEKVLRRSPCPVCAVPEE